MSRIFRILALALLGIGVARAQTTETIPGRLERNTSGDFVATLDLASDRLGLFADKPGQDANFELAALRDLIVERFHYLLRLRAGEEDFAVKSIALALPATGEPMPRTLALTATWHRPGLTGVRIVTNTDSPLHHFALALVDRTTLKSPAEAAPVVAAEPTRSGAALASGIGQVAFGGVDQLLFALVLYFSARRGRELLRRLMVFALASSAALILALGGTIPAGAIPERWLALGIAASIVGVAAGNCFVRALPYAAWSILLGGFGLVHGVAWGSALTQLNGLASPPWSAVLAATCGIQIGLMLVFGVLGVCTAAWWDRAWYTTRIAMPASRALGLAGVILTSVRVRETFVFFS